jgi:FMN-dependent NADH-azoreductase
LFIVLPNHLHLVCQHPGILFSYTSHGPEGFAKYEKWPALRPAEVITALEGPIHALDFQEPYLPAIFSFAGIEEIYFIHAQPMDMAPGLAQAALAKAQCR